MSDRDDTRPPGARGGGGTGPDLDDTVLVPGVRRGAGPVDLDDTALRGAVPTPPSVASPSTPQARSTPSPSPGPAPRAPARPALPELRMRFRVGDDAPVALDAIVYLGRSPRPPRVPDGPVRLVVVGGATVSGTHLELRQTGQVVVATDLRSTNGSVLAVPGAAPRRMAPGESAVVVAGTTIDLGDGAVVEILPRPRLG
jgi:hypothetical protein